MRSRARSAEPRPGVARPMVTRREGAAMTDQAGKDSTNRNEILLIVISL